MLLYTEKLKDSLETPPCPLSIIFCNLLPIVFHILIIPTIQPCIIMHDHTLIIIQQQSRNIRVLDIVDGIFRETGS